MFCNTFQKNSCRKIYQIHNKSLSLPCSSRRNLNRGGKGGDRHILEKAFINALFMAAWNFANSVVQPMNIATVDSSGVCLYPHCIYALSRCIDTFEAYIYVSAWGFLSLLVQTVWAMRRPQAAGRVTVRSSPLFFVCMYVEREKIP